MITKPNLEGRVAIITGSSRGIGKELALALAGAGAGWCLCANPTSPTARARCPTRAGRLDGQLLTVNSRDFVAAL